MISRFTLLALLAAAQLPPVSWSCPMHPEVLESARGSCPICGMPLEPVRLTSVWSCPVHSVIAAGGPGRCRICGRELAEVTMAVTWRCGNPESGGASADRELTPHACADGSAAKATYAPRPHGNHNPQHGGAFFMAPDNWHHLEGAYPRAGVFYLYLYDDFSRPLPRAAMRRVQATVIAGSASRLALSKDGTRLEGQVSGTSLPIQLSAKVRFKPGDPEYQFDFTFEGYSADGFGRRVRGTGFETRPPNPPPPSLAALRARAAEVASAIDRRAYAEIWVPALQAKDLALAIEADAAGSPEKRASISIAVKDLVRAAWMLDAYGDLGNAAQIGEAHARFTDALGRLEAALETR